MDQYKVLYIGRDLVFQEKILKAFSSRYDIQCVRSTVIAAELLQKFSYDVIVFDVNILSAESFDGIEPTSIILIYKISILKNVKAIFFYLYEKKSNFIKSFQKLSEATFKKILEIESAPTSFGKLGPSFNTTILQQIREYFGIE